MDWVWVSVPKSNFAFLVDGQPLRPCGQLTATLKETVKNQLKGLWSSCRSWGRLGNVQRWSLWHLFDWYHI